MVGLARGDLRCSGNVKMPYAVLNEREMVVAALRKMLGFVLGLVVYVAARSIPFAVAVVGLLLLGVFVVVLRPFLVPLGMTEQQIGAVAGTVVLFLVLLVSARLIFGPAVFEPSRLLKTDTSVVFRRVFGSFLLIFLLSFLYNILTLTFRSLGMSLLQTGAAAGVVLFFVFVVGLRIILRTDPLAPLYGGYPSLDFFAPLRYVRDRYVRGENSVNTREDEYGRGQRPESDDEGCCSGKY